MAVMQTADPLSGVTPPDPLSGVTPPDPLSGVTPPDPLSGVTPPDPLSGVTPSDGIQPPPADSPQSSSSQKNEKENMDLTGLHKELVKTSVY